MQDTKTCLALVLAAGEGTRMKSRKPKVMHPVANLPMLSHVLRSVDVAGATKTVAVIGPGHDEPAALAQAHGCETVVQSERKGTAHAVLAARAAIEAGYDHLLVLFADTPLIRPETLGLLRAGLNDGAAVVVLGFEASDPFGYGRLLTKAGELVAIREHRDATEAERAITLCNAGIMAIDGRLALILLDRISASNAQGEFYLTDIVEIARAAGHRASVVIADEAEVQGVNDRLDLARAEAAAQRILRERAMRAGATLIAPETVFLSHDTRLGRDVVIEPHVVFGPGVDVGDDVTIHAFSHLEGATVAAGASIGPYARLRPGARIGERARVGNFVEIKNVDLGAGAKANHLTYLGDAIIGAGTNIGAGTITCNYDGFRKFTTTIGEGAFIGSNSALVAPVTIGAGAFVGSGSVITDDVPADSLAVGRGRQVTKPGWAAAFRALPENQKKK